MTCSRIRIASTSQNYMWRGDRLFPSRRLPKVVTGCDLSKSINPEAVNQRQLEFILKYCVPPDCIAHQKITSPPSRIAGNEGEVERSQNATLLLQRLCSLPEPASRW